MFRQCNGSLQMPRPGLGREKDQGPIYSRGYEDPKEFPAACHLELPLLEMLSADFLDHWFLPS